MSNLGTYLRLLANGDQEVKVQAVRVTDTPAQLSSEISTNTRRRLFVYNATHYQSGEVYLGDSGVSAASGFPIPKGTVLEMPIHPDVDPYFVASSGEIGDIRVLEIA